MATAISRYLDPAAAGLGDGSSWANAYTTWDGALSDIAADYPDFTVADVAVTLHVRGSVDTGSAASGNAAFGGTSPACYFKVKGDISAATGGLWGATAPTLTSAAWEAVLRVDTGTLIAEDLQILSTRTSGSGGGGQAVRWVGGTRLEIHRCKLRTNGPEGNAGRQGLRTVSNPAGNKTLVVTNTVSIDFYIGYDLVLVAGDEFIVYNSDAVGTGASSSNDGFWLDGNGVGTARIKNCRAHGFARYDFGVIQAAATMDFANNASEDTTATSYGAGGRGGQTFTLVDRAGGDFHLAAADTGAKGYGLDLSLDANYAFDDDIDGEARATPWDIGSDNIAAQAASEPIPAPAVAAMGDLAVVGRFGGFQVDAGSFMDGNQDPAGNPVSYTIVDNVDFGTLEAHVGGALDYTPNLDFVGEDFFTYYVYAGGEQSTLGTVTFLVEDRFEAVAQQGQMEIEGEAGTHFFIPFQFVDEAVQGALEVEGLTPTLDEGILGVAVLEVHGEQPVLLLGHNLLPTQGLLLFVTDEVVLGEAAQGVLTVDGAGPGLIDLRDNDGINPGSGPEDDGGALEQSPVAVHLWLTRQTRVKLRR